MKKRQGEILERLRGAGEVFIGELAERFGVSEMTIRRDLILLEREGHVARTHGGAILSRRSIVEFAFWDKGREHRARKVAIGREVAGMVEGGMTITLEAGTTTLEVAHALSGAKDVTVLTSSLAVASALYAVEGVELVLLGGRVGKYRADLSGALTEENLGRFKVDMAVVGADAVKLWGLFTTDVEAARVRRAMIAGADRAVLAADSSKFEATALELFAEWEEIDCVVTDDEAGREAREWLGRFVGEVIYARTGTENK